MQRSRRELEVGRILIPKSESEPRTVRLRPETWKQIDKFATENNRTVNSVVADLLEFAIAVENGQDPQKYLKKATGGPG